MKTTQAMPPVGVLDGTRESSNLTEILAVDTRLLLLRAFPEVRLSDAEDQLIRLKSVTTRMAAAAAVLQQRFGLTCLERLRTHPSDTVRGWAPYVIGLEPAMALAARLELVRASADDAHFGVREWAWLGVRTHIAATIERAIDALVPWTQAKSPRVRRFATESTRPRGVWATKIDLLLERPHLGGPLLEPLSRDSERYVLDSVANWINDAAKSQPRWAQELCARWLGDGSTQAMTRLCARALRSVGG